MTQHIFICTFISINSCRVNSWRKSIFQCSNMAWLRDYIQIPSAQVVRVSALFTFGRWCLHGSLVCFRNSKLPKCLLMCTGPFLPRKTLWLKWKHFFFFSWGQKIEGSSKSALKTNWENSKCAFHQVWDEAENFSWLFCTCLTNGGRFSSPSLQLTKPKQQLKHDEENFHPDNRVPEYCALTIELEQELKLYTGELNTTAKQSVEWNDIKTIGWISTFIEQTVCFCLFWNFHNIIFGVINGQNENLLSTWSQIKAKSRLRSCWIKGEINKHL